MAGIGIKPSALANPTALGEQQDSLQQALQFDPSKMPAPSPMASPTEPTPQMPQAPEASSQGAPLDPMEEELKASLGQGAPEQSAQQEDPMEAELKASLGNLQQEPVDYEKENGYGLRAKLSFATTPYERKAVMEQAFPGAEIKGNEDTGYRIKTADGKSYKFKTDDHWWDLNAPKFLADHASDAAGLAGMAATDAAVALTAPVSGGTSLFTMGALGSAADKATRDAVARGLGIPMDPSRNLLVEHGVNAVMGGLFNKALGLIDNHLAEKYGTKAIEAIKNDPAIADLRNRVAAANIDFDALKAQGILPENFKPYLDELTDHPTAQTLAKKVAGDEKLNIDKYERQNVVWDALHSLVNTVGNLASTTKTGMGDMFQDYVSNLKKVEGKLVGETRDLAIERSKGQTFQPTEAKKAFDDMAARVGLKFDQQTGQLMLGEAKASETELADQIEKSFKVKSRTEANSLANRLIMTGKMLYGNPDGLPLAQIKSQREILQDAYYNKAGGTSAFVGNILSNLERGFRNDMDNNVEKFVLPSEFERYNLGKAKYGVVRDAEDSLRAVLEKGDVSTTQLISRIFDGSNNLDAIRAVRGITAEDPQLFQDLVGKHLGGIIKDADGNMAKAGKNLNAIDKDVLLEIAGGDKVKADNLTKLFNVMEKVGKNPPQANKDDGTVLNAIKAATLLLHKTGMFGSVNFADQVYESFLRSKKAQEYIQGKPVEYILKGLPEPVQEEAKASLTNALKAIGAGASYTLKAAKTAAGSDAARSIYQHEVGKVSSENSLTRSKKK